MYTWGDFTAFLLFKQILEFIYLLENCSLEQNSCSRKMILIFFLLATIFGEDKTYRACPAGWSRGNKKRFKWERK